MSLMVQGMFLCHPAAQLIAIIVALEEGSYPSCTSPNRPGQEGERELSARIVEDILCPKGLHPKRG
jgi:hypothetical protein